jgi:hypothetical protein
MENFWVFFLDNDGLVMWLGMSKLIGYRYAAISKFKRMSVGTGTDTGTGTALALDWHWHWHWHWYWYSLTIKVLARLNISFEYQ